MTGRGPRADAIDEWLTELTREDADVCASFERVFTALWDRARATLGPVTLVAVTRRVLFDAAERFPAMAPLSVDERGVRWDAARRRMRAMRGDDLRAAATFIVRTWMTVLGDLTGGILAPGLDDALSAAARTAATHHRARGSGRRKDPKS